MWITELLLGCAEPDPRPPRPTDPGPPWQLEAGGCPEVPVGAVQVRIVGEWNLTVPTTPLLAELDGDRCVELLVPEVDPSYQAGNARLGPRVTLVEAPTEGGLVGRRGLRVLEDDQDRQTPLVVEAYALAFDAAHGELLATGGTDGWNVGAWRLERGTARPELVGELTATLGYPIGGLHGAWSSARGPLLMTDSTDDEELGLDHPTGSVRFYPLPIRRLASLPDLLGRLYVDDGRAIHGLEQRFSFTGGPSPDLAVADGFHVGVVADLPAGDHALGDVATVTIEAEEDGLSFGAGLTGGDLDGDGAPDLLVGAPSHGGTGRAWVFRGPFPAGSALTVDDAEWTFTAEGPRALTGAALAVGDLDGDGAPDLAIGQPGPFLPDDPGAVVVFRGPLAPGPHRVEDADRVLRSSGPPVGDHFGQRLLVGDLDGDGVDDLVVAAPHDHHQGRVVGSVQIVYGRPAFFD